MTTPNDNQEKAPAFKGSSVPHPESDKWHKSVPVYQRRYLYEQAQADYKRPWQNETSTQPAERTQEPSASRADLLAHVNFLTRKREQQARVQEQLEQQCDELLAALAYIETRASYALSRPDKTNNDIQMDYIKQQAQSAIAKVEKGQS